MLELVFVPLERGVDAILESIPFLGISFELPIHHSFENPGGVSPLHGRIGWVPALAEVGDLVDELFNRYVFFIFHTLIMAAWAEERKGKVFLIPLVVP